MTGSTVNPWWKWITGSGNLRDVREHCQTGQSNEILCISFLLNNGFSGYILKGLHMSETSCQKSLSSCSWTEDDRWISLYNMWDVCGGACCRLSWVLLSKNILHMLGPYYTTWVTILAIIGRFTVLILHPSFLFFFFYLRELQPPRAI